MKKTLLLFLVLTTTTFTFSQDKTEIKNFFWSKNDNFKTAKTTPDKWKNESAVMILKYEFYDYHKYGKSVTYTSSIRKRIKLQDAAAVKEFSEFSFQSKFYSNKGYSYRESNNYVGVKIVKPTGKEIEIDTEKEAKTLDKESKLAIPNLEIGDIIDYYFYSIETFKSKEQYGFEQVETTLGDVYPTMDYQLDFQTENDFFVNFQTYNGSPELKEIPTNKGNERRYELRAKDLDKNEFPRWFYPLVELPCYKFQVFFARSGSFEARADAFLSKDEKTIKKSVSKDDIFEYFDKKFVPTGTVSPEKDFLKQKNYASDEERVREVYYFARHYYFTQYIEAQVINREQIFNPFFYFYGNSEYFSTEQEFINHFMMFLKKINIDYDIIVATNRNNGSMDDLLIQRNTKILLRVNTSKPLYLEYFSPFSSADQFDYGIENTKAYALQVSKGKKVVDAESVILPSSTVKDNVSSIVTTIGFNEDFSGLKVKRNASFLGHFKESEQQDKMYFFDYVNEDYAKYGTKGPIDMVSNKKDKKKYALQYDALLAKYKEKQKEELKKSINEELGFDVENSVFEIKSTGRFGSNSPFVYEQNFDVKNSLIKKAGENYILEIGKMLSSQIEIDKKEKDRTNNIYLAFPRSFDNEIIFEIPAGYSVSGIEKLNKKIENETGLFTSNAVLAGNKLTIKTKKQYNNYFEPNKNWSKMVDFLDGAYQFTQEKILLKKN